MPISRYARLLPSRPIMNDATRVMSVCQAMTCMSIISLAVLLVVVRNRARPLHVRQLHRDVLFLGALNAALDVADRLEIFVELPLVAGAERCPAAASGCR